MLTLKQYMRLYNEIAQHVSLVTQPMDTAAAKVADIRASTIFAEYVKNKCYTIILLSSCDVDGWMSG